MLVVRSALLEMKVKIFRKRFVPMEVVDISKDEVLKKDDEILITKWKAIKPRNDVQGGISFAFLKEGYKISRFFDNNGNFIYWYCDIVDSTVSMDSDGQEVFTLTDLLVDVKILPDGKVELLDVGELGEAFEKNIIEKRHVTMALERLDKLLQIVYSGNFPPQICEEYDY